MRAIFYDRKNQREVSNKELMFINYVVDLAKKDDKHSRKTFLHEHQIGELGYRSEKAHSFQNWDLTCMYTDLIFLRFEDWNEEEKDQQS